MSDREDVLRRIREALATPVPMETVAALFEDRACALAYLTALEQSHE